MAFRLSVFLAALALALLLVVVYGLAVADGPRLDRLQRRLAWGRLPPAVRQYWASLGAGAQERWKLRAAEADADPEDGFEALAARLAFGAWRAGPGLQAAFRAFFLEVPGGAPPRPGARGAPPRDETPAAARLEAAVAHTSDPQNVHDSLVLQNARDILARLRADQAGAPLPSLGAIVAGLEAFRAEAGGEAWGRAAAAAASLDDTPLASLGGGSAAECLRRVWLRADAPPNRERREALRRAAFDALVACWEEGDGGGGGGGGGGAPELVCATGRAVGTLASLATLDYDPENSAGTRLETLRNEAYRAAAAAIRRAAEEAAAPGAEGAALQPGGGAGEAAEGRRRAARAQLAATAAELAALPPPPPGAAEALADELRALGVAAAESCFAAAGLAADSPLAARLRAEVAAAV